MPLPLVGAKAVLDGVGQFQADSNKVNQAVGGMHASFGAFLKTGEGTGILIQGLNGIATAGLAAAGALVKAGKGMLGLVYEAGPQQNVMRVFKNMTESFGVDSTKLLEQLRKASYGAADDFELMTQANKSMVGAGKEFGKMFAEQLPLLMKVSREAAKAQGLDVDYMFNSVVTGIKRMSPMLLDNLGFQISLADAQQVYADKLGITVKEMTKEQKQLALLNAVVAQGDMLIQSTGGHMDNVQTTWIAWGTAISNAKKYFAIELLPILQRFMDMLGTPYGDSLNARAIALGKAITAHILPAIDAMANGLSAFMGGPLAMFLRALKSIGLTGLKTLANSIGAIFTGVKIDPGALFETFYKLLEPLVGGELAMSISESLRDAFLKLQEFISPVVQYISDVLTGLGDLIRSVDLSGLFNEVATGATSAWQTITNVIQAAWDVISPLVTALIEFFQNGFTVALQSVQRVWNDLQPTFTAIGDAISAVFMLFIENVLPLLVAALTTVVDWVNANWPSIQEVINTVIDAVAGVINWFTTNVLPYIIEVASSIIGWLQENWPQISDTISKVMTAIWSVVTTILDAIKQFWKDNGAAITEVVGGIWNGIKTIINVVLDVIKGIIDVVMDIIAGNWNNVWEGIKLIVENIWNGIKTIISVAIGVIAGIFKTIAGIIGPIWDAFWGGIKTAAIGVIEAIKTAIADLAEAWNNFWGGFSRQANSSPLGIVNEHIGPQPLPTGTQSTNTNQTFPNGKTDPYCFLESTIVTLHGGGYKFIQDIKPGDQVLSFDPATKQPCAGTVADLITNKTDHYYTIMTAANRVLDVTGEHPFWTPTMQRPAPHVHGDFTCAKDLRAGDELVTWVDNMLQVDIIHHIMESEEPGVAVYNLNVLPHHTYVAADVLVHNLKMATGGILDRPTFTAGEQGAEVVAPLGSLLEMMRSVFSEVMGAMNNSGYAGYGAQTVYGGDSTINHIQNLTLQSINRPGTLAMEFEVMGLAHL